MSIGLIESCAEWAKHEEDAPGIGPTGQMLLLDLEPALDLLQRVDEELRDYNWMVREVERLEGRLDEAIHTGAGVRTKLSATYGIDAAMPKAQGAKIGELSISEKEFNRLERRLKDLKKRVVAINSASEKIKDEREKTILDCLLAGERVKEISGHMGISRQSVSAIRRSIVRQLTFEIYRDEIFATAALPI